MIEVVSSVSTPEFAQQLREWFIGEWGEQDAFDQLNDEAVPAPLLAADDGDLIGGLAFSCFYKHQSEEIGLWINALLVTQERRRQGIASRLIRSAEIEAIAAGYDALFALTDIPELYLKQGWAIAGDGADGTVVRIDLPR